MSQIDSVLLLCFLYNQPANYKYYSNQNTYALLLLIIIKTTKNKNCMELYARHYNYNEPSCQITMYWAKE